MMNGTTTGLTTMTDGTIEFARKGAGDQPLSRNLFIPRF